MSSNDVITYLLYVDDDAIPLDASMTLGNHLDNEVMVPGEDVADFHLRVEVTPRGPVFVPLGEATFNINGVETNQPLRAIVGDVIGVGQATLQVGFEVEQRDAELRWYLVDVEGAEIEVIGELAVGRAEGADVTLADAHISRFHARIVERGGCVWLQDLGSANGTCVNAERIYGGVRLFHGDTINFDRFHYQLIGKGGDLTPVQQFEDPERGTAETITQTSTKPHSISRRSTNTPAAELQNLQGPYLEQDGKYYPLQVGENILGAGEACDIPLIDAGISARQLSISVSADGVRLTNLASQVQAQVNGQPFDSITLANGDKIACGTLQLVFHHATQPITISHSVNQLLTHKPLIIGLTVAALLLFTLLLFI